jgi:hypothetical protein
VKEDGVHPVYQLISGVEIEWDGNFQKRAKRTAKDCANTELAAISNPSSNYRSSSVWALDTHLVGYSIIPFVFPEYLQISGSQHHSGYL